MVQIGQHALSAVLLLIPDDILLIIACLHPSSPGCFHELGLAAIMSFCSNWLQCNAVLSAQAVIPITYGSSY